MARLLGLDVGEKTIGTAVTDENGVMAFPRETILRKEGWRRDMAALRTLVAANQICEIVVGLPLMLDGTHGIQAEKVEVFVSVLRRSVRVPIVLHDERLSTREADRVLMQAKLNREQRKRVVDSVAACILLQAYIDNSNAAGSDSPKDLGNNSNNQEHSVQAPRSTNGECKIESGLLDIEEVGD